MTNLAAQLAAVELAWTIPDGRQPSADERDTLAAFMGWGGLARAFDGAPTGQWLDAADRLDEALPAHALAAARDQVDTSFFTPAPVADAVWQLLDAAGFRGGRALEPGCGAGAFMITAPSHLDIQWTGVELDPTSVRIARLLHPDAEILEGRMETTPLRDDWFDIAIGNVPFSSVHVYDKEGRGGKLHNYFAQRAVAAVRPGGYVVLITSRHALDAKQGLPTEIDGWDGASFVGAVRLPSGAFVEAGTQTVTDIIVIRKNDDQWARPPFPFTKNTTWDRSSSGYGYYGYSAAREVDQRIVITDRTPSAAEGSTATVAAYWDEHREHIAGDMLATGYEKAALTVRSQNPREDIDRAVRALSAILPPLGTTAAVASLDDVVLADADGRKEGSFHLIDGKMHRVEAGTLVAVRGSAELAALVSLRDLALNLLELESDTSTPDAAIAVPRADTLAAYEAYVARFGRLNRGTLVEGKIDEETGLPALSWRRPAMGGFRRDPDSALVMALEVFDQESGEAGPAPILLRRVNRLPERIERVGTPAEALAVALGESGKADLDRIAGLLELPDEASAAEALGDLVYRVGGRYLPAAEALSGNVRHKLARARAAAGNGDPEAARYAAALENVMPADLGAGEIDITLGSPFVTPDDISAFLKDVLGARWPKVSHTAAQALWEVEASSFEPGPLMEWGVPQLDPGKLVEAGLNNRLPEVFDQEWRGDRLVRVRNPQASAAANTKLELIRDRFSTWVWEDAERAARIATAYNEALNSHVPRVYDGSGLTFPGLAEGFTPWAHQRAAVERIVSSERCLLAHPVGAGKTSEMVMGARTLRQFGLANKPMIVVPNHLLDQIAREAQQVYPTGRFLIATKDDLARDARRLFAARCATGDWDAVIITHSAFGSIPLRPEIERDWIEQQKSDLRWALMSESDGRSRGAKAIARAVRSLDAKISKLRSGKNDPDAIYFDQLGVDYLMVDEAHLFRRLDTGSTSRDNGMGSGSSKRATDLLMKIETLAGSKPGAPVVSLFTGTPWSNTLAETWVWQRYLQSDALDAAGLLQFDAWVSAFIRYETSIEVAPDGSGFRMHRRPVGVVNAPELKMLLGQVADIIDPESLGLVRPEHEVVNVTVPATPGQADYVKNLADRADAIRSGGARREDGDGDDNMLLVCNDGRKVALDPKLVGLTESSAKIDRAAELIAEAYHQNAARTFGNHPVPGGFQLAFMDLGTPHPGDTQTYGRLRRAVVDRGVPAHAVRFVHEATTDKARAALFAACRDGEVALLIASTAKAGMGTNIQTRLTHLWHIDAPWLPSDVVQRDGRAVRPGNLSGTVRITRLVTEGTFDAYMWQALERKSRSFDALYATGATAREIEDVSGATMSYGEVKALASGNPLLLDQAKVRAEVKQLQVMRAMHLQGVNRAAGFATELEKTAAGARHRADLLTEARKHVTAATDRDGTASTLAQSIRRLWQSKDLPTYGVYGDRIDYRGIRLHVEPLRRQQGAPALGTVTLHADYRSFADVTRGGKEIRRSAETVAARILDDVDHRLDTIDSQVASLHRNAASYDAQAAEQRAAAEGAHFDQEPQLRAAVTRLAEIDAAIAEDAREAVAA